MKIIFSSVAPHCNTGYGTQGRYLIKAFQELGHEVFVLPHHGLKDNGVLTIDGVDHLPLYRDAMGFDVIGQHVRRVKADAVISFHDVWTLKPAWPREFKVPWITYSPIDSMPVPRQLVTVLREARYCVAMSRFGQQEMRKVGIDSTYIPHAIDTNIYRPGDKAEARRILNISPDKFLCLIVAANYYYPNRKALSEQMAAFAEFHRMHPDSELLFHTSMTPTSPAGGLDLNELLLNLGLEGCTAQTPEYDLCMGVDEAEMALIYRAADVLLGASYAEGFGLCQAEAQACGTPIIVHDFSASPEYLFAGLKVPSAQRFWNLLGGWQAIPSIKGIVAALDSIYAEREAYVERGLAAAARVHAELDRSVVTQEYWKPFLERVANRDHVIIHEEAATV